jgi:hypothetical protein
MSSKILGTNRSKTYAAEKRMRKEYYQKKQGSKRLTVSIDRTKS